MSDSNSDRSGSHGVENPPTVQTNISNPDELLAALDEQNVVGKATATISGDGTDVLSTSGGVRYLYSCPEGVIWIRPDGFGRIATKQTTVDLLAEFDNLALVAKSSISARVQTELARLLP